MPTLTADRSRTSQSIFSAFTVCWLAAYAPAQISTAQDLIDAISNGSAGDTVVIAPGVYELAAPLEPKAGMSILGAGAGQTIIRSEAGWVVGTAGLPDNAIGHTSVNTGAYLVNLGDNTDGVTISGITFSGPGLHGAVYGNNCDGITITENTFDDFLWSAVRLFRVNDGLIARNDFIDAGGRSGVTQGQTGGAVFVTFTNTTDIHDNRFTKTPDHPGNFFGIKGRKATDVRIFNNTINVSFSIEFPFENDFRVEIFNNYLDGVVSVPKFAGGPTAALGESYTIKNNYFTRTYSIEGPRNGLLVEENLFDFSTDDDGGNLLAAFGSNASPLSPGPTAFRNNNVRNPGRGVFWSAPVQNNLEFTNNHVIAATTSTPRTEGLFGIKLNANNAGDLVDLSTITISDNIFELSGLARPLVRNSSSVDLAPATTENNTLTNVSDAAGYANPGTGAPRGPLVPLRFRVGVGGEFTVDGFEVFPTPPCLADLSGDGALNNSDINLFVAAFVAQDAGADFNQDGAFNNTDINLFVAAYLAGCG